MFPPQCPAVKSFRPPDFVALIAVWNKRCLNFDRLRPKGQNIAYPFSNTIHSGNESRLNGFAMNQSELTCVSQRRFRMFRRPIRPMILKLHLARVVFFPFTIAIDWGRIPYSQDNPSLLGALATWATVCSSGPPFCCVLSFHKTVWTA